MRFRDLFGWMDETGEKWTCGGCGATLSKFDSTCHRCGATISNSESFGAQAIITILLFVILFPLFNLPAFLPAWIVSMWFAHEVFPTMMEGFYVVLATIATVLFLSAVFWKILKYALIALAGTHKIIRTLGNIVIWGYILGCYGGVGYYISVENELSLGWTIGITILSLLLGGGYCSRKLGLISDEDT